MSLSTFDPTRRALVMGGAAAAGGMLLGTPAFAARPALAHPDDRWLDRMTGAERHLFDSTDPAGARMLTLMRHFHDIYRDTFGQGDGQVSTVGTFYGGTTFHGLDDAMWRKYRLDPGAEGGAPAPGNPWRTAPVVSGQPAPTASIEALQRRGAEFILCRAALRGRATTLAEREGIAADRLIEELEAHLLPGVTLVASVIVAIQRAQARGVSYYRVG